MTTLEQIDRGATGRAKTDRRRMWAAVEMFRAIMRVAADARKGDWVHADTKAAFDRIEEYAKVGVQATDDEEWAGEDFPP